MGDDRGRGEGQTSLGLRSRAGFLLVGAVGLAVALGLLYNFYMPSVAPRKLKAEGPFGFLAVVQPSEQPPDSFTLAIRVPEPGSDEDVVVSFNGTYDDGREAPSGTWEVVGHGRLAEDLRDCRSEPTLVGMHVEGYEELGADAKTAAAVLYERDTATDDAGIPQSAEDALYRDEKYRYILDWSADTYQRVNTDGDTARVHSISLTCYADASSVWQSEGAEHRLVLPALSVSEPRNWSAATSNLNIQYTVRLNPALLKEQSTPEPSSTTLTDVRWETTGRALSGPPYGLEPTPYASSGLSAVFVDLVEEQNRQSQVFFAGVLLAAWVTALFALVRYAGELVSDVVRIRRVRSAPGSLSGSPIAGDQTENEPLV